MSSKKHLIWDESTSKNESVSVSDDYLLELDTDARARKWSEVLHCQGGKAVSINRACPLNLRRLRTNI
jgi:hypothetical protein